MMVSPDSSKVFPGMESQVLRLSSALRTSSAASGLLLVFFLLLHLAGVALAPLAPQHILLGHVIPEKVGVHGYYHSFSPYKPLTPRKVDFTNIKFRSKMKVETTRPGKDS